MRQAKDTEEQGEPAPQAKGLQTHMPLCMSSWDHPHLGPVRDVRWLTGVKITKEGLRPCVVRPRFWMQGLLHQAGCHLPFAGYPVGEQRSKEFGRWCSEGMQYCRDSICEHFLGLLCACFAGLRRQCSNTHSLPCEYSSRRACAVLGLQLCAHI